MATVTVKKAFNDLKENVYRVAGDTFEATDERAKELTEKLGSEYVSVSKPRRKAKE